MYRNPIYLITSISLFFLAATLKQDLILAVSPTPEADSLTPVTTIKPSITTTVITQTTTDLVSPPIVIPHPNNPLSVKKPVSKTVTINIQKSNPKTFDSQPEMPLPEKIIASNQDYYPDKHLSKKTTNILLLIAGGLAASGLNLLVELDLLNDLVARRIYLSPVFENNQLLRLINRLL